MVVVDNGESTARHPTYLSLMSIITGGRPFRVKLEKLSKHTGHGAPMSTLEKLRLAEGNRVVSLADFVSRSFINLGILQS